MREILVIFPDMLDHVSFHDLHMIDIIQQLEVRRTDTAT